MLFENVCACFLYYMCVMCDNSKQNKHQQQQDLDTRLKLSHEFGETSKGTKRSRKKEEDFVWIFWEISAYFYEFWIRQQKSEEDSLIGSVHKIVFFNPPPPFLF